METETIDHASDLESVALRVIVETIPIGALAVDVNGAVRFHNVAAQSILGIEDASCGGPSERTGFFGWYLRNTTIPLSSEDLPLTRVLRGEEVSDELLFVRNKCRPAGVWIQISGSPLRDLTGQITGGILVFRDTTEGRLSQQNNVLLSHVVEQIADGVLLTDMQGFIGYVNPAFEVITGFSSDDVRGKTPRILKSDAHDSAFYQDLWDHLLSGRPYHGTLVNRRKTGELYYADETITPMVDERGNLSHFVAVMQDVTEALQRQEQETQLRLARQIQQKFYRPAPVVHGFDIAAGAYPADQTSGDYFDFIPLPHSRLVIAVGDVEGHGFGSALVMALTRAYVHSFAAMGLEVDQILTQVNRMLVNDLGDGCFVTLMLAFLDVCSRSLVYAGAGHIPGYVLGESGQLECTLESGGPPLGLFPDVRFSRGPTIILHPDQLLVLLTDGITESSAPNGPEWGSGALDYLRTHRNDPADKLVHGLYLEAQRFAGNKQQKDDITSVILKVQRNRPTELSKM